MARTKNITPGSQGGQALLAQRGVNYFRELGSKGGRRTAKRYGKNYMSLLGSLGAHAVNENLSNTAIVQIEREIRKILS